MAIVTSLHFSMNEEDTISLSILTVKPRLCTFQSTCKPLCNIGIDILTLLNILISLII